MRLAELLLALPALAAAGTAGAAITCVGSDISLYLGTYESFRETPLDSSTTFVVTCSRTGGGAGSATVTIALGTSFTSGSIATRALRHSGSTDQLKYNLYRDAFRNQVWGNTLGVNSVSQVVRVPNNGSATATFTIFSRIEALQDVRVGGYGDFVTATVNF